MFFKKKVLGDDFGEELVGLYDDYFRDHISHKLKYNFTDEEKAYIDLSSDEFLRFRMCFIISLSELTIISLMDKNTRKISAGLHSAIVKFCNKNHILYILIICINYSIPFII